MNRTLAEHLGSTPHLSPLLRKARFLGLGTPRTLLELAVARGCTHYTPPDFVMAQVTEPGRDAFSNAELAIALCSGAQAYDPMLVRCAAQLLGDPDISPSGIARLARMERCEPVIRHIAASALEADTGREEFWTKLLSSLRTMRIPPLGVLPHRSRFMIETGVTDPRHPRPRRQWLRPASPSS